MVQSAPNEEQADRSSKKSSIDRTQVITALITAIIGGVATAVPFYFGGKEAGTREGAAAAPTVRVTVTAPGKGSVPDDASPSASEGPSGVPFSDEGQGVPVTNAPLIGDNGYTGGSAEVMDTSYDQALIANSLCSDVEARFELNRHYKKFTAMVGVMDGSPPGIPITFYVYVDGKAVRTAKVAKEDGVKKIAAVDVSKAAEIKLFASSEQCHSTYEGMGIAWINPVLAK